MPPSLMHTPLPAKSETPALVIFDRGPRLFCGLRRWAWGLTGSLGTIEALEVFVTDVLSPNLDLSTVELLTPDGGSVDAATRTVRWALLGRNLLPSETDHVLMAVKPVPNLPSGTEIRNKAEIQFEIFDSLVTNEVVNIIDSIAPTCTMAALPAETTSLDFPIAWEAKDAIGKVQSVSVFVSEDGQGFKPFLDSTQESRAMFSGQDGVRYEFLCVTKDTAGNVESQDAETDTVVNDNAPQNPAMVNDKFAPQGSGDVTTAAFNSTPCAAGTLGTFTIGATFHNISQETLSDLSFTVNTLTGSTEIYSIISTGCSPKLVYNTGEDPI